MKLQMTSEILGSYLDWASIDYQPAMKKICLNSLDPHLIDIKTTIDVGCSKGWASILMARQGIKTIGIGLNRCEIEHAEMAGGKAETGENLRFIVGDILTEKSIGSFDLVLMIRLLTCFPVLQHWNRLLDRAYQLVNPGGLIYIYDFLLDRESNVYMKRYLEGQRKGLRLGNFIVNDKQGNCLFIAHHHLEEELEYNMKPYENLHFAIKDSFSMNGNKTKVFEFIGKKNLKNENGMDLQVGRYTREEAPKNMVQAAAIYEERFGICFDSLSVFPLEYVHRLHRNFENFKGFEGRLNTASGEHQSILDDIECLSGIANQPDQSDKERSVYFQTLQRIYKKLPENPGRFLKDKDTLFIGPEREGRILAETLGWLPGDRSLTPNAKRIHYMGGLVVGLNNCNPVKGYKRCVIIDGAIASGATLISIIRELENEIKEFQVYSVHATIEGLCGLFRYGASHNLDIHITVGHTTTGLNNKYYAVDDVDKEIVGDLGDTIFDIAAPVNEKDKSHDKGNQEIL